MFASQGLSVPRLLSAAGIDAARLERQSERFGADEISLLWDLAVAWSGNTALGLDPDLASTHVNFDVVGYAMASSPDLHSGLHEFARYLAVISDAATFELQPQGGDRWLVLGGTGYSRPVPRQRYTYGLLSLVTLCRWLTRREVRPLAVHLRCAEPSDAPLYSRAFQCPVLFGKPENQILLAQADLDAPVPSRNPSLLAVHERVINELLASLGNARTSYRVSEEIVRRLHRGEPRRKEIAATRALTDRTLQRRLHAESTTFQQLLDDARRELAQKHLADENCSLDQVADRLGFVDHSNFFRACRRWFGVPPRQYRQRLATGPFDR
ncbi:HTH-type transcriptional regulator VirS [Burkholderiaceae bacterium]|nr:HTH-type transcriptional regulator VirS [Burkholderiaceae bacterium]